VRDGERVDGRLKARLGRAVQLLLDGLGRRRWKQAIRNLRDTYSAEIARLRAGAKDAGA
jgi:hypothetical protein